jgi:hypothetical protein
VSGRRTAHLAYARASLASTASDRTMLPFDTCYTVKKRVDVGRVFTPTTPGRRETFLVDVLSAFLGVPNALAPRINSDSTNTYESLKRRHLTG